MIPQEFIIAYNVNDKGNSRYIFMRVTKGMYVLPQKVQISHYTILQQLEYYGYHTSRKPPILCTYYIQLINFKLVVDDFAVKYSGK